MYNSIFQSGWSIPENEEETKKLIQTPYEEIELSSEELGFPDDSSLTEEEAIIFWRNFENPWLEDPNSTQYPKIEPRYFKDSEGQFVFVPGSVHWLYGKPGTKKSFLALTACVESNGIYIDFENGRKKLFHRIQEMNYPINSGIRAGLYFPESYQDLLDKINLIKKMPPTLVVIDAFSMMAGMSNLNIESNTDVIKLISEVINPLKMANHAVVVIDHVTKNGSNHDYPIGSESKKAQSDVLLRAEYDGKSGETEIYVCKDRDYVYEGRTFDRSSSTGEVKLYGTLELDPITKRAILNRVNIEESEYQKKLNNPILQLKNKIMGMGPDLETLNQTELRIKLGGKDEHFRKAKKELIEDGYLIYETMKGQNGGTTKVLKYTGKEWSPESQIDKL